MLKPDQGQINRKSIGAQTPKTPFTGSGTAVTSKLQPIKVAWRPPVKLGSSAPLFSFRRARFAQTVSVSDYQLVQLANGAHTLFSAAYGEKMHPGLGPAAEADLLYVRQLKIRERLQAQDGEFVIWDVGLGAAANAIAVLRAARDIAGELRLVSFDNSREPLEFALKNASGLGYVGGYENELAQLLHQQHVQFGNGKLKANWEFHVGDFPAWLAQNTERRAPSRRVPEKEFQLAETVLGAPPPHAIFFDAFSPAKNPAMWTLSLFADLFAALDPQRRCALTTYSRSTLIRTTLLLAGFYVGAGHATGLKEETTIAANVAGLISEPLGARWLERAERSDSAEPLNAPVYSRARLSPATLEKLRRHPQFN
jgi:hypothetical protein